MAHMNNTTVIHPNHRRAGHYLEQANTFYAVLADERDRDRANSARARYASSDLGKALKLAEIHATLNVGDQLARIADALEQFDPDHVERLSDACERIERRMA